MSRKRASIGSSTFSNSVEVLDQAAGRTTDHQAGQPPSAEPGDILGTEVGRRPSTTQNGQHFSAILGVPCHYYSEGPTGFLVYGRLLTGCVPTSRPLHPLTRLTSGAGCDYNWQRTSAKPLQQLKKLPVPGSRTLYRLRLRQTLCLQNR
ncbi:hypothetical protein GWK47_041210 [Chionoecetes opilio]|uniref:Uncharacterized protein n=1 Tax=Chionoecetes opilio TaxID=41210 RepID=A0A8J4YA23_CHIOP|nr:hypothetical protein GWK47_041210 [Chionoecetes opilio]